MLLGGAINSAQMISHLNTSSDQTDLVTGLSAIRDSMNRVNQIFKRMPEKCDPIFIITE